MDILVLTCAFVGIVVILLTKYLWQGAFVSVASFISYFFVFGTGNILHFLVLLIGLLLMALELFLPSFGVVGIVGIMMSVLGLCLTSYSPMITLFNTTLAMCLSIAVALVLLKCGFKFQMGKELVLNNALNKSNGFQSHQKDYSQFLNKIGYTTTNLRPVGRAEFDGKDIEVLSVGEMILKDEKVTVYKLEGNNVFVKKYSE